jgi:hypothetical protein
MRSSLHPVVPRSFFGVENSVNVSCVFADASHRPQRDDRRKRQVLKSILHVLPPDTLREGLRQMSHPSKGRPSHEET